MLTMQNRQTVMLMTKSRIGMDKFMFMDTVWGIAHAV